MPRDYKLIIRVEDLAGRTIARAAKVSDDKLGFVFSDGSVAILVGDAWEDRVGVGLEERAARDDEYALGLLGSDEREGFVAMLEAERRRIEARDLAELDRLRRKYGR